MNGWREYNFDGLIGPTHNYAGLSHGNIASASNSGQASAPREAALQGIEKMRLVMRLGVGQGFFLPHTRPNVGWLQEFGFAGSPAEICAQAWREEPDLLLAAISASAMWAANAATVSPAPDTTDGRTHFMPANLATMAHRGHEWPETQRQLKMIFSDERFFCVHGPVPARYGDEGAANFMRIAASHGVPGTEIMVHGTSTPGGFPARQSEVASRAIFRAHGVTSALHTAQSTEAINAGAFHNDVVAVANERVLFTHAQAFADRDAFYAALRECQPGVEIVEVAVGDVPLADAIRSYLFNSQLITLPDGRMALILPTECARTPSVRSWLDRHIGNGGPIAEAHFVEVRESMRNGGGPACLRLRVLLSQEARQAVNPAFILTERRADDLSQIVERHWPKHVLPGDLGHPDLWEQSWNALQSLADAVA
jgi:succinylarginine dihydrolase